MGNNKKATFNEINSIIESLRSQYNDCIIDDFEWETIKLDRTKIELLYEIFEDKNFICTLRSKWGTVKCSSEVVGYEIKPFKGNDQWEIKPRKAEYDWLRINVETNNFDDTIKITKFIPYEKKDQGKIK